MLRARGLLRPHEAWKGEGRYKGRAPTARAKTADIVRLASEGAKCEDIAKRLGIESPPSIACWQPREPRQQ